jgi:hypothetical protein
MGFAKSFACFFRPMRMKEETADLSTTLRSGRDDKFEEVKAPRFHEWSAEPQIPRLRSG